MDAEAPLDEQYFTWLYGQVADAETKDPARSWWRLLKQFYTTEFVWVHHDDKNRLADGKELRNDFISETGAQVDPEWVGMGCSMLELTLGLAKHLAFLGDGEPPFWFWQLMENLYLRDYTDDRRWSPAHVEDVLLRVIQRHYDMDGEGGFFPLREPTSGNQRGRSLWEQLNDYVAEQYNM